MTLDEAPLGLPVTVEASAVPAAAVTRRLAELGIRTGAVLHLLTRTSGHGAIVAIGDDRLAVSREILRGVRVVVNPSPAEGAPAHG
jgi:Fe2+ transport system protein FeoA